MDTKSLFTLLIIWLALFYFSGCRDKCTPDEFGIEMQLIVPINTSPSRDTFSIGDTLWIEANIDKEVEVEGHVNRIRLDSFNFFTEFFISEISDTIENFNPAIEIIEKIGQVEDLPLITALVHPLFYEEFANEYKLLAGIVFNESGRFYVGSGVSSFYFEYYEHPAMYVCEDDKGRRSSVSVSYTNESTNEQAYEDIFLQTNVEYLVRLMDYPDYQSVGGHTFIVKE